MAGPSPLKGLTRAQITARAAARRAELAKKKKKPRAKKTAKVRVSQATINKVASMGKAKALQAAGKPGASAEFKEAVKRYYSASGPKTVGKKRKKPKVISTATGNRGGRTRAV